MMFSRPSIFQIFSQTGSKCSPGPLSLTLRSASRCWSSGAIRHAQLSKPIAQRPPAQPNPASHPKLSHLDKATLRFAGRRPEGFGRLERKVAKQGNIVLFKAPSQRSYILGAYGIATFCFAYSVYNSYVTFRDPKAHLPTWQKTLLGGICVIMSVMGTVFVFRTSRLIKTLTAVDLNGRTYLRFAVRPMIPFRKLWVFDVSPREIAFARRLVVPPRRMTLDAQTNRPGQKAIAELSFFQAPFKKLSFSFWKAFLSTRRLFTQENFIFLDVKGQKGSFRVDLNGYLSDDLLLVSTPM
jgi:hypothetical protein